MYEGIGTEDTTQEHTIVCIAAKNVIAVTKVTLKIDANIVIQDWEKRQMPRLVWIAM